jgi:hypothetical protein
MKGFITIIPFLVLLAIPISAVIRMFAALFSVRVRESIAQHRIAHLVWLVVGIAVVILTLLLPPLNRPLHKTGFMPSDHLLGPTPVGTGSSASCITL